MAINFGNICGYPNVVPPKIRDKVPKFNGEGSKSTRKHLEEFIDMMGYYELDCEDVVMKLFVQSLKCDARDWFSFLPASSIHLWDEFKVVFMEKFGERVNPNVVRIFFIEIHRSGDELIPIFILRFMKPIRDIPENMRPNDVEFLVVYLSAFDNKMSYLIRGREPTTLHQAYHICMNIEKKLKYSIMKGHLATSMGESSTFDVNKQHVLGDRNIF